MVKWDVYEVTVEFEKPVVGGIPKSPEVIAAWIESRAKKKGRMPEEIQKLIEKVSSEVYISEDDMEKEIEKTWTTFKGDKEGIYIEDRNIKAMLREAASTLGLFKGTGSTARKQTFQHGLTIKPYRIRFYRDGEVIREPEDIQERPIIIDYKGNTISALKREDIVKEGARITFYICIVANNVFSEKMVKEMVEIAQEIGIGAARSQGFGKFKIVEFKYLGEKDTNTLKELN